MAQKNTSLEKEAPLAVPLSNILSKIIEKERELELSIKEAHEEGNKIIQDARDAAAGMISAEKEKAQAEADKVRKELRTTAESEAKKIQKDTADKIKAIKSIPASRVSKTISHLLDMVLPSPNREVTSE